MKNPSAPLPPADNAVGSQYSRGGFYVPHKRVTVNTGEFTFTKQSAKDECDINNILAQYKRTGIITHISSMQAQYLDLPSDVDYQASIEVVKTAEEAFSTLPAKVRDRFGNDPFQFLGALYDPDRRDEMEELGVLRKKQALDDALASGSPAAVAGVAG